MVKKSPAGKCIPRIIGNFAARIHFKQVILEINIR